MFELWLYIVAVNLIAFAVMGMDKRRAIRHARRIPERQLFILAVMGGAVGMWIGMRCFRHKTKHLSFVIGVPIIAVLHVSIWVFLYDRW